MNIPILFKIKENTFHNAFLINSIIAGIAAGLLLEYHRRDILSFYKNEKTVYDKLFTISFSIFLAIFFTYIAYWITRILFGFGNSILTK